MTSHSLVPQSLSLPVAQMRSVFCTSDVERKLARLQDAGQQRDFDNLRIVYERMLERGPERFQVKPQGVPDMANLYDRLPTSQKRSTMCADTSPWRKTAATAWK